MNKKIIITGGGTAGHVYPGLSVAESLKQKMPDIEILWIGSKKGIEQRIVTEAGIDYCGILTGKLRRYFSIKNFLDLFRIIIGFLQSQRILKKYKPDLVFSKGGFVSVPPVAAAGFKKIPVYSHESDISPGLATKLNTTFSDKIFVSYEKTREYFQEEKTILSGNPVRSAIYKANAKRGKELIDTENKKIILVIGGSLGALQINKLIEENLEDLCKKYFIIHQTGSHHFEKKLPNSYRRYEYIGKELPDFLAMADLVISRAGASALWENAALGKASILIPLGTESSRGDQEKNAEYFKDAGAAIVLKGKVSPEQLYTEIESLMNNEDKRKKMQLSASRLAKEKAADFIANYLMEVLNKCK